MVLVLVKICIVWEVHPVLKDEEFALAFMNNTMKRKFRDFGELVCIDGTHGITKYKGWELTTVLVKDETKAGFPVAFMISNKQDQIIQELFLGALKKKLGAISISTAILTTDDDIKYYNAWIKTMENKKKTVMLLACFKKLEHSR